MPHLRKKYEGGYWGYAERVSTDLTGRIPLNSNTKILLSHAKK